jgi:hypothetical protein
LYNNTPIADGTINLNISANDTSGNTNSTYWNFSIDTVPPRISKIYPVDNFNASAGFNITGTASDDNSDSVYTNVSYFVTNFGNYTNWNFTNTSVILGGNYSVLITANDSAGNTNSTTLIFNMSAAPDSISPDIEVTYPQNNSNISGSWINISGTASDANPDSIWTNHSNFTTMTGTYNNWNFTNTSPLIDGIYVINITANDTLGNENSTTIVFNFITYVAPDTTPPLIEPSTVITPGSSGYPLKEEIIPVEEPEIPVEEITPIKEKVEEVIDVVEVNYTLIAFMVSIIIAIILILYYIFRNLDYNIKRKYQEIYKHKKLEFIKKLEGSFAVSLEKGIPKKYRDTIKHNLDVVRDIIIVEVPKELKKLGGSFAWTLRETHRHVKVAKKGKESIKSILNKILKRRHGNVWIEIKIKEILEGLDEESSKELSKLDKEIQTNTYYLLRILSKKHIKLRERAKFEKALDYLLKTCKKLNDAKKELIKKIKETKKFTQPEKSKKLSTSRPSISDFYIFKKIREAKAVLELARNLGISNPAVSDFYTKALKKIRDAKEVLELEYE